MFKTKKRGREEDEMGSVCACTCVLQDGCRGRVKLGIYGEKESTVSGS